MPASARLTKRKIHVDLPAELHQKLRIKAALDGLSIQALVTRLVEAACDEITLPTKSRKAPKDR
jgi:plasmid stability protein